MIDYFYGHCPRGFVRTACAGSLARQLLKQHVTESGAYVCRLNALAPGVFHIAVRDMPVTHRFAHSPLPRRTPAAISPGADGRALALVSGARYDDGDIHRISTSARPPRKERLRVSSYRTGARSKPRGKWPGGLNGKDHIRFNGCRRPARCGDLFHNTGIRYRRLLGGAEPPTGPGRTLVLPLRPRE